MEFSGEMCPRAKAAVRTQELPDGSTLLFDLTDRQAYPVNQSAALIWKSCNGEHTVEAIVDLLFETYDAPRETIAKDVSKVLEELAAHGLLE